MSTLSTDGYSYVLPKLAIGSAPPVGQKLPFDVLVLCAEEYQPPRSYFPEIDVYNLPFDDAAIPMKEISRARRMGHVVAQHVSLGDRVLVTCYAGRNRSGLVTAYALMELGYSADRAIEAIREVRGPFALSNGHFVLAIKRDASLRR